MIDFKRLLGFVWAGPLTILGLAYVAVFTACGWYRALGRQGDAWAWQLVPDKMPKWLTNAWASWAGQAIGNVIVVRYNLDTDKGKATLRHEQEHVHQYMMLGVLMPIIYGAAYLGLRSCRYANPYYDNPFEIDARRAAGQVVDVVGVVRRAVATGRLKLPLKKP